MASSPLKSKSLYHARSNSLPSGSHPLILQFNEHLARVMASEATPSSISSMGDRLCGLDNLFDCVDDLLLLPWTQRVFFQEPNRKWVEEALECYLKLLDACSIAKDAFSQVKQDAQDLRSCLRRRRDTNGFSEFLASRKKAKKVIQKLLKDLKSIIIKQTLLALDKDHETLTIVAMLKEVEGATLALLESFLQYILGNKVQSRSSPLSFVSKLMHRQVVPRPDEETILNEFEKVEAQLLSLNSYKANKSVENVQDQLAKMESSMTNLEEGLERLFRHLIKTRVSLLNILN